MVTKVIIFGSSGCLARHIIKKLNIKLYKVKKISRRNFSYINNNKTLFKLINNFKPKIIINCAAMSELEKCRTNPRNAYIVNTIFPFQLSILAKMTNSILIHFSTDAVFDGKKKSAYSVKDKALPSTVYGQSKLMGEELVADYKNSVIIRLPLIYGKYHKKQIIGVLTHKLKRGKKIFVSKDVYSTPINSDDVANFIKKNIYVKKIKSLIMKKIVHLSNNQRISLFHFMKKISFILGKSKNVIGVKDSYFKNKYTKPKNLGLKASIDNLQFSNIYKYIHDYK